MNPSAQPKNGLKLKPSRVSKIPLRKDHYRAWRGRTVGLGEIVTWSGRRLLAAALGEETEHGRLEAAVFDPGVGD